MSTGKPTKGKNLGESGIGLYMAPGPNGVCNVVTDFNWTVTNGGKNSPARAETPVIRLEEFQQTTAALEQEIRFWATQADQITTTGNTGLKTNPYENLYTARRTGNEYTLPFYNSYNHAIMNNWGSNKGVAGALLDATIVQAAKVLFPSTGIESPKAWEGTQIATYSFTFDLLNTVDEADINRNIELIRALTYANLSDRINSVAAFPPVLYSVDVPGVRTSPAAVIANFTVENVGQINHIDGANVPDAYRLNFNIAELITESRRIYESTWTGKKVTAIVAPGKLTIEGAANSEAAQKVVDAVGKTKDRLLNPETPKTG